MVLSLVIYLGAGWRRRVGRVIWSFVGVFAEPEYLFLIEGLRIQKLSVDWRLNLIFFFFLGARVLRAT